MHTRTHTPTAGFDRIAPTQPKHRHADRQAANTEWGNEREKEVRERGRESTKDKERKADGGD